MPVGPGVMATEAAAAAGGVQASVNSALASQLGSSDGRITSSRGFTCELRKRSTDMQQAINAAMFGTPHCIDQDKQSDRMAYEEREEQHHHKIQAITAMLHNKLVSKAECHATLMKESIGYKTSEEVLQNKVQEEEQLVALKARKLKQKQGEVQRMHLMASSRLVKIKAGEKAIMLLEMKIRDLNVQVEGIMNTEHVKSHRCRETNQNVRALERELYDLKADNDRLSSAIENKVEDKDKLFQKQTRMEDQLLRGAQRAAMQSISLTHELTPLRLKFEGMTFKCEDAKAEHDDYVKKLDVFQELHAEEKREYLKRIQDEKSANERLVVELADKTLMTRNLFMDLKEEEEAKMVLMGQLADKDGLCLQMGKRLYRVERSFLETSGSLKARSGETEELENVCENMKSSGLVLNGKLKKEQSATRKLMKWAQMERLQAEDLDNKLTNLVTNEATNNLTLGEEDALKARLKEMLDRASESARKYKQACHETEAQRQLKADTIKDTTENVDILQARHAKVAAAVEVFGRELNGRTRKYQAKWKQLMQATESFNEKVADRHDEIKRLQPLVNKGNNEVLIIQNILETNARKSVEFRREIAKVIGDLDLDTQKLSSGLRQALQRNEIMEQNQERGNSRIKEIAIQMMQNEEVAAETGSLNSEEENLLETRLRNEMDKAEGLGRQLMDDNQKLFAIQARLESEDHSLRHAASEMRENRNMEPTMMMNIENSKETEMEGMKRIEALVAQKDRTQERLEKKIDDLEDAEDKLLSAKSRVEELRKEQHDAEVSEADFFSAEKIDASKIHGLENEIAMQQEQHDMDTNMVKLKIIQLQDALKLKMKTMAKLQYAKTQTEEHNRALELRQMQSATEVAQTQKTFETMLDEERRKTAVLRNLVETQARDNVTKRQSDLAAEEALQVMEIKLGQTLTDNECLMSESYRKGRSLNNDSMAYNKISYEERELFDRNMDLQERQEMLEITERGAEMSERDLNRTLTELLNENKRYKLEVAEATKNERTLLLEVEAERMGVHTATDHPEAEAHAEEAMQKLLHDDMEAPMQ